MCLEYISFVQATSAANVDGESRRITALYTEDTYLPHQNKTHGDWIDPVDSWRRPS